MRVIFGTSRHFKDVPFVGEFRSATYSLGAAVDVLLSQLFWYRKHLGFESHRGRLISSLFLICNEIIYIKHISINLKEA